MKPFILKQHDKDFAALRELRNNELVPIAGGFSFVDADAGGKLNTCTVTPNSDGGDDGKDAD